MPVKTLIFIPTYNERENVENMARQLLALGLDTDLLFMDDCSPDGTGEILDRLASEHPRLSAIHRAGKLGIGSAHLDGIRWAYDHGYERLITMDCDFTHTPAEVLRLIDHAEGYDVTIGSRYLAPNSLPWWNPLRKSLTGLGHFLTKNVLGVAVDATGALRGYDLRRIPRELFDLVTARGYAFFFESMFILLRSGFSVKEFPIELPARTYGHSKMNARETVRSGSHLMWLRGASLAKPARFRLSGEATRRPRAGIDPALVDSQGWDSYWDEQERPSSMAYAAIAELYRVSVIKPQLEKAVFRNFAVGAHLLHAGCGSGQVDMALQGRVKITAVDISPSALRVYQRNNPAAFGVRHVDILNLPFAPDTFDGIYNLGVLEHFTSEQIHQILAQFHRVLKPDGRLVIFWPHAHATSVAVLKGVHWLLNDVLKKPTKLHPPEISPIRSKEHAEGLVQEAGFRLIDYYFGPRDVFVQAIIVAEKA
ncbi:MAG: glycosyltransferase [Gemmatimonadaceae bacterium]